MDWAALGGLLVGVGSVVGGLLAFFGKRGENRVNQSGMALTGYSTLTDNLQEELARKTDQAARAEAEVARLRRIVMDLGGDPS
ncbi:MAG TPA: hypothetical protein VFH77_15585 [Streptomyces sp.]|nr:hypothetical protein [Streptomyces sp.]